MDVGTPKNNQKDCNSTDSATEFRVCGPDTIQISTSFSLDRAICYIIIIYIYCIYLKYSFHNKDT